MRLQTLYDLDRFEQASEKLPDVVEAWLDRELQIADIDEEITLLARDVSDYEGQKAPDKTEDIQAFINESRKYLTDKDRLNKLRLRRQSLRDQHKTVARWLHEFVPVGVWIKVGNYALYLDTVNLDIRIEAGWKNLPDMSEVQS